MMRLVSEIKLYLKLIKVSIKHTFQIETAYPFEYWSNILSTFFYTIALLIFVDVIYSNVDSIAGYSRPEMLLFIFLSQIVFYLFYSITFHNSLKLIEDVRYGVFDYLLLLPVPSFFYASIRRLRIFSTLRDAIPPIILLFFYIPWGEMTINFSNIMPGLLIMFLGLVCFHCFQFILSMMVFRVGDVSNLADWGPMIMGEIGMRLPYEGFPRPFNFLFLTLIPVLTAIGLSTSVMLGKSDGLATFLFVLIITIIILILTNFLWKVSLREYSSASS